MIDDLVSIITPSYNTGKFIKEAIDSVLAQSYKNWELIIIDDCSTDDSVKIVETIINRLKDNRIKLIVNDNNSGAAISRNKGLKMAKGRWIAFLDSDDLWEPNKLEKQIRFMQENNYKFSYTNYVEIDEKSNLTGVLVTGPKKITRNCMYNYCWLGCLTVMYDVEKIGLIQISDLKKNNDYAMWLEAIKKENCYLLNEELAMYRQRQGSISNATYFKLIKWHYILFRVGEKKSRFISTIFTIRNIIFGIIKKIVYVKKGN